MIYKTQDKTKYWATRMPNPPLKMGWTHALLKGKHVPTPILAPVSILNPHTPLSSVITRMVNDIINYS